ncbi:hypothetical protein LXL04_015033 [Taraxacum kok-saghyz]
MVIHIENWRNQMHVHPIPKPKSFSRFPENINPAFHYNNKIFQFVINSTCFLLQISNSGIIAWAVLAERDWVMDNLLGLLRIRVKRGIDLAIRDFRSSDPYVVVTMGDQKLKTGVVDKNLNPVWEEDLTLPVQNTELPVTLMVFDHDLFTKDDEMGDAEFGIQPFYEAVKMHPDSNTVPNGTILKRVSPDRDNCLSEESVVTWKDGKVTQNMTLRLRNVECGEIELDLFWIEVPK